MNSEAKREYIDRAPAMSRSTPLWAWAAFGLVVFSVWAVEHPYAGLSHDARIYLLLALHSIQPDQFANDLLVAHGSQGDFTIGPRLVGHIIRWTGDASLGLFVSWFLAYLVFVAGVAALAKVLIPRPWCLLAFALVLVLPGDYSAEGVLAYGEAISTSRPAAEGFTLLALAAWFSSRYTLAVAMIILALLLHPLMAMPGAVMMGIAAFQSRLFGPAAVLAFASIASLFALSGHYSASLLQVMDAEWLSTVRSRAPYLFPDRWSLDDWGRSTWAIIALVLGLSTLREEGPARSIMRAALLTALLGLFAATLTVAIPNVIFIQGQPWRWIWPGKVISIAVAPIVAARLWRSPPAGRAAAMLSAASWITIEFGGAALALVAAVLWLRRGSGSPGFWRLVNAVSAAVLFASAAWSLQSTFIASGAVGPFVNYQMLAAWMRTFTVHGMLSAAVVFLAWWWALRSRSRAKSAVLAVPIFAAAVISLSTWHATLLAPPHLRDYDIWKQVIPEDAIVFWSGNGPETWLMLERAAYLSETQATASLFSKETASELVQRANRTDLLYGGKSMLEWNDYPLRDANFSREAVELLCADEQLGFVVLPSGDDLGDKVEDAVSMTGQPVINGEALLACRYLRMQRERKGA